MFAAGVAGAVPAAYPKTIGLTTVTTGWNPDGGTRRSYNASTPVMYVDTVPGWVVPAIVPGYTFQMSLFNNTENNTTASALHVSRLRMNGVDTNVYRSPNQGETVSTGFINCPNPSGTLQETDGYTGGTGGTSHMAGVMVQYQWNRP
jgi:hypothetical protein